MSLKTFSRRLVLTGSALCLTAGIAAADQQILDDLIVDGSLCAGQDCVNGESFGFDTLRLKENNLRMHFDDTSTSASFPRNDWRFIANDSSNGGDSYMAIEDSTAGRQVFRVDAGAPSNALYVDSGGDVGMGTSTPVVEAHIVDGDTPTLRLEQDGSSGFTPQTWDVAGNESGFFIRDATNGSQLAFRIRPGADASSIDIAANNDVGIGTASPSAPLHVYRTNGTAALLVQEASGTSSGRTLMTLANNGNPKMRMENTNNSSTWDLTATGSDFSIEKVGEGRGFTLLNNSNLEIGGSCILFDAGTGSAFGCTFSTAGMTCSAATTC